MVRRKKIRTRGKIQLSKYFQKMEDGDSVAVIREHSVNASFPERLQGRTGVVIGKRGRAYIVKIMDHNKEKKFIIAAVHLNKIKTK